MISSPEEERPRQSPLTIAIAISLMLHSLGAIGWIGLRPVLAKHPEIARLLRPAPKPTFEPVATSDAITIERRVVPRIAPKPRPRQQQSQPAKRALALAPVKPQPVPSGAPTLAPSVPPTTAPTPGGTPHPHVQAKIHVAQATEPPAPPKAERAGRHQPSSLSPAQLASLDAQFRRTIADAQHDVSAVERPPTAMPATMHRLALSFEGIHADLRRGQGIIEPVGSPFSASGRTCYYTHYRYMYGDGRFEEDDVPWPFCYPPSTDPFAHHVKWMALQPPPPGFTPNRQLKPQLAQFFGVPSPE